MLPASAPLPPDIAAAFNAATARVQTLRLELRWFATVSSTMDLAAEAVDANAPEGLVLCAEEQSAGRGRLGRVWSSPPGAGLYSSVILRPPHDPAGDPRVLPLVTLMAGVAVRSAIVAATGLAPQLKWPNDVMIGDRKLAGILAEGFSLGTPGQAIVLGVGINVVRVEHQPEIAARATSLEAELGHPVDRAALLEELLVSLGEWYERLKLGETDDILRAWRAASPSALGTTVVLADTGTRGVTAGIDDRGALLVDVNGELRRVLSGAVEWCR